jgi:hypothetical protein
VFLYNITIPELSAFSQQDGNIYWLDVQAQLLNTNDYFFGWKTAITNWNDDAVFSDSLKGPWTDMHYPIGHYRQGQSINLAFVLETVPEPTAFALLASGIVVMAIGRRRRQKHL